MTTTPGSHRISRSHELEEGGAPAGREVLLGVPALIQAVVQRAEGQLAATGEVSSEALGRTNPYVVNAAEQAASASPVAASRPPIGRNS